MSKYAEMTPAYGRDYKTQGHARESWEKGEDWILNDLHSPWDGKPINKPQAEEAGYTVTLRFDRCRKVCTV